MGVNRGYKCVRPVRMTDGGKFEYDKNGRCGASGDHPDWRPYTDPTVSLKNLSEGPVEISIGKATFKVGFMQYGMSGKGKHFTRPVRMLNVPVPEQRRPVVPEQRRPTDEVNHNTTRPSNMSGHSNPRQPAHVRQSAMSGLSLTLYSAQVSYSGCLARISALSCISFI